MSRSGTGNVPTLGGWVVTVLLGVAVFFLLRNSFAFYDLSAMGFGLAAALFMLLLLTGSGLPEEDDVRSVRKIVPAPEFLPPITGPTVAPTRVTSSATRAAAEPPKAEVAAEPASANVQLRLSAPRGGKADDLKVIEGIGPALEKLLHAQGIFHIDQIAGWSDADVAAVDAEMAKFKGRIARDRWVAQARIIVTEGLEAFRERAKTNNY
jgi:predicted flap endonuclease-1-like 5' DNA nuclease